MSEIETRALYSLLAARAKGSHWVGEVEAYHAGVKRFGDKWAGEASFSNRGRLSYPQLRAALELLTRAGLAEQCPDRNDASPAWRLTREGEARALQESGAT